MSELDVSGEYYTTPGIPKKKLYFQLEWDDESQPLIGSLQDCMDAIEAEISGLKPEDDTIGYMITPVWMTDDEVATLPEWEG